MKKLLNKPWVVALLACVAVALVAQSVLEKSPRRPRPVADEVAPESGEDFASEGAPAAGSLTEALAGMTFPDQLPDPFAPRRQRAVEAAPEAVEATPGSTDTVRLSAIWAQDGASFVLLNGRICRAGDTVGPVTIASIERDGVWLTHWNGRAFVRVGQDLTLTTPASPAAQPRTATHEG